MVYEVAKDRTVHLMYILTGDWFNDFIHHRALIACKLQLPNFLLSLDNLEGDIMCELRSYCTDVIPY